jgi:hypothetical protein
MRRSIQRRTDAPTQAYLKGSRWLLVKNRPDLTSQEETQLQQLLAHSPELRTLYLHITLSCLS